MDDFKSTGRARGRPRGTPRTAEEELAAVRKPGEVPAGQFEQPISSLQPVARLVPLGGRRGHNEIAGDSEMTGSGHTLDRSATKDRRDRVEKFILKTKPASVISKQGTSGDSIQLLSNYYEVIAKPNWRLMQYCVDMKPDVELTKARKALMYQHKERLPKFMFDGTMLFSTARLSDDDNPIIMKSQSLDNSDVVITVKLVGEVMPTDYNYIHFFNIVLKQAMEKMGLSLVRKHYYDPLSAHMFAPHKLEVWQSYVTSIRQHEEKILLCCKIENKVIRTDTVLDQMTEFARRTGNNMSVFRSTVEKALLGCIVITRYNNRAYRIDQIDWDKNPRTEFVGKKGESLSLVKYYADKYGKTLRDLQQPLIISVPPFREQKAGNNGPLYLVPELCNMIGLSEEQRANFKLMADLGRITRQEPSERSQILAKFSNRLNSNAAIKEELNSWNLAFAKELVQFRSRILNPELILGDKSSKATYQLNNADWGSAFSNWQQISVVSCSKWIIIHNIKDETVVREFINSLIKVGPSLGMVIRSPKVLAIADKRPDSYIQALHQAIAMNPGIVMIVIPNSNGEHYAAIKKVTCCDSPIPSQCITSTVLNKPKGMMSVATKVALQMNCKMGGEPWVVPMPLKDIMVIGYDTYHDTAQKGRSVGAVVASMNQTLTKWMSCATMHTNPSQELNDNLLPNISKILRKFQDINGSLPSRIIMYRDGVGDGQIPYVMEHEVKAIKECFKKAGLDQANLKFTYIIVSKRINTRFFKAEPQPSNPPSGTIVDDVVTLPERYDFFLVSQSVRQGTVNPTSYNVVEDSSGLKPDHIQKLTYKLCHLYYNWPGTVRVPAPCQFAHKLAVLVGESLHMEPNPAQENLLYYL